MNLFKRLAGLFSGGGGTSAGGRYLTIYLLSRRCNEPVSGQVDTLNELSQSDDARVHLLHAQGDPHLGRAPLL